MLTVKECIPSLPFSQTPETFAKNEKCSGSGRSSSRWLFRLPRGLKALVRHHLLRFLLSSLVLNEVVIGCVDVSLASDVRQRKLVC